MARLGTFRSLRQRNARLFFAGMLVSNCRHLDAGHSPGLAGLPPVGPGHVAGPGAGLPVPAPAGPRPVGRRAGRPSEPAPADHRHSGRHGRAGHRSSASCDLTGRGHPARWSTAWPRRSASWRAIDNPARRSLVTELVDEEDIPNVLSLNTAVMTGSRVVRPGARRRCSSGWWAPAGASSPTGCRSSPCWPASCS